MKRICFFFGMLILFFINSLLEAQETQTKEDSLSYTIMKVKNIDGGDFLVWVDPKSDMYRASQEEMSLLLKYFEVQKPEHIEGKIFIFKRYEKSVDALEKFLSYLSKKYRK